jgi:hypothetical protein
MSWTKEHQWQEAALRLRQNLFNLHRADLDRRVVWGEAGRWDHEESTCATCRLLTETRWCMRVIEPPVTDVKIHEGGLL